MFGVHHYAVPLQRIICIYFFYISPYHSSRDRCANYGRIQLNKRERDYLGLLAIFIHQRRSIMYYLNKVSKNILVCMLFII